MNSKITLEVCADSIDSATAARKGGAARVELCSGLAEGGVTPSTGLIRAAVGTGIKVNVLIRPRGGDFIYSPAEVGCMIDDIACCAAEGVNGVVIGALTADGDIDTATCRQLIEAAKGLEITFHRAFDVARDPYKALDDVIGLGCDRLLTSGQADSAENGVETLAALVARSNGRISIMAGSGVNASNARFIALSSGVNELHASARMPMASIMNHRNETVKMGAKDADEYCRMVTSEEVVRNIINELNRSL